MNQISKAEAQLNVLHAAAIEEASLATVEDQIREQQQIMDTCDNEIESLQDAIRARRKTKALAAMERTKLRRKRAIFARAAFSLREVDRAE